MPSNMYGSNPANGANYSHRNAVYRDPWRFRNAVLPSGALSFLLCAGDMRGAVHDGKTCGGAAHFPLFHPSCDFSALNDTIDCPNDTDGDGASDPTLWTLITRVPPNHSGMEAWDFVGAFSTGAEHPTGGLQGVSIENWVAYTTYAAEQPPEASDSGYWIPGSIDDMGITGFNRVNPDSKAP